MTLELDRITENLNGDIITLELFKEDDTVGLYIATSNSSGCEYTVQSVQDVLDRVQQYLYGYDNVYDNEI